MSTKARQAASVFRGDMIKTMWSGYRRARHEKPSHEGDPPATQNTYVDYFECVDHEYVIRIGARSVYICKHEISKHSEILFHVFENLHCKHSIQRNTMLHKHISTIGTMFVICRCNAVELRVIGTVHHPLCVCTAHSARRETNASHRIPQLICVQHV